MLKAAPFVAKAQQGHEKARGEAVKTHQESSYELYPKGFSLDPLKRSIRKLKFGCVTMGEEEAKAEIVKTEPTQQPEITKEHTGKFCPDCGTKISENAVMCPKCGCAIKGRNVEYKNPGIAAVLSFFWTGLGQIYNGEILKGILLMCIQVINVLLMLVVIGFITFPIVWVYGIWDANKKAKEINAQ